ncbi:MAG: hypothetical protein FE834_02560, partial [Gammaproteobacteria bacterium]|nr:hypothetical protein [Gammaproteobacteria bacterium]
MQTQVKTQKQIKTLQDKAQTLANKLNKEIVVVVEGKQHIQVQAGTAYQLSLKDVNVKDLSLVAKKNGNGLEVSLKEGVVIFDDYFEVCATDLSCLVSLPAEDGGLYHIVADVFFTLEDGTQVVYFYGEQSIISTEFSVVSESTQNSSDTETSTFGVVQAFAATAIVIACNSSDSDDPYPTESLGTTVAWGGAGVDASDGSINITEYNTFTLTGKLSNVGDVAQNITITAIKFIAQSDSGTDINVTSGNIPALSASATDTTWTLAHDKIPVLVNGESYKIEVTLSADNNITGAGSNNTAVLIDTTAPANPVVSLTNDTG